MHEALNVPASLGSAGLHSLARRFHPPHVSEELGLRVNVAADRTLDLAIGRIRAYRARLRRDPDRWSAASERGIRETREFVEGGGDPLYATHSGDDAA